MSNIYVCVLRTIVGHNFKYRLQRNGKVYNNPTVVVMMMAMMYIADY